MSQKFIACEKRIYSDGTVAWSPGGPFDCLGHFAKVQNCRVCGLSTRYTCYATGYADTFFSVPACTRIRGEYVAGYFTFTRDNDAPVFVPYDRCMHRILKRYKVWHSYNDSESGIWYALSVRAESEDQARAEIERDPLYADVTIQKIEVIENDD